MKRSSKGFLQIGLLFLILILIALFIRRCDEAIKQSPQAPRQNKPETAVELTGKKRTSAIGTALKWGGLSELPESAEVTSVQTKGGMFTRQFIVKFSSNPEELDIWIENSGLNKLTPVIDNKTRNGWAERPEFKEFSIYYEVLPGHEGAVGGLVFVDRDKGKVVIDMSWS